MAGAMELGLSLLCPAPSFVGAHSLPDSDPCFAGLGSSHAELVETWEGTKAEAAFSAGAETGSEAVEAHRRSDRRSRCPRVTGGLGSAQLAKGMGGVTTWRLVVEPNERPPRHLASGVNR